MERTEIKAAALAMKNIKDLCRLLNQVKRDALGDKSHPFLLKQITYYSNPRRTEVKRYKDFSIPKKSGGVRVISAPVRGLKSILTSLNTILQALYEPSKHAMGFVPGRSVVDNAKIHLGQNYVYNLDMQDFFPSIDKSRIWKRLTIKPFNFPSKLADVIAGLCTMRLEVEGQEPRYVLPQGAPTSPTLTNIICEKLDRQLGGLAKKYGLRYSRYADDITFSSMHYIYSENGDFIRDLKEIIAANHFTINEKKTRLQKKGERQEVTGLVLSDKVNVVRTYTREIRTLLHIWEKYGSLAVNESYMRYRKCNPVHRHKGGMPIFDAVLMGKLQYLRMVKGKSDATFNTLYNRFKKLVSAATPSVKYNSWWNNITYIQTMNVEEFERALSTQIEYNADEETGLYFTIGDIVSPIVCSRSVPIEQLLDAGKINTNLCGKYQISLCYNGTSLFFMLHKRLVNPKYTKHDLKILDDLENELEKLTSSSLFSFVLNDQSDHEPDSTANYKEVKLEDIDGLALENTEWGNVLRLVDALEEAQPSTLNETTDDSTVIEENK